MPVIAIIGAQWGDEGKGKIVDMLAETANVVARFSGGDNAGHTVVNPAGEFKLHLVPAGIFYPQCRCLIGHGVVVNPESLLGEIAYLSERGVDTRNLFVSDRAHVVMPYHIMQDRLEEQARQNSAIGTTHKGIGPAYADKAARVGIRVGDLLDEDLLRSRLTMALALKNQLLTQVHKASGIDLEQVFEQSLEWGKKLSRHVADTSVMIQESVERDEMVLLEGAQGVMLDLDVGTYPYVTSSHPTAAGACLGVGLPPTRLQHVLAIFKAYTTRVGGGPMPTELLDEIGDLICERGNEYGATTGRRRRCGWFDAVAARYSMRVNGFTGAALTRLDILDAMRTVKVCAAYKLDGKIIESVPGDLARLAECQPVYEEMPGWETPTSDVRRFEDLPEAAQRYVLRLSELIGCTINLVSVGASRSETIIVKSLV
ncbi:MAG: adenylosuccinate synthase [Chloroflexota bacterium]|nr:MAG: adenylosuccinate synthase [Chloroflexota bacterium]